MRLCIICTPVYAYLHVHTDESAMLETFVRKMNDIADGTPKDISDATDDVTFERKSKDLVTLYRCVRGCGMASGTLVYVPFSPFLPACLLAYLIHPPSTPSLLPSLPPPLPPSLPPLPPSSSPPSLHSLPPLPPSSLPPSILSSLPPSTPSLLHSLPRSLKGI